MKKNIMLIVMTTAALNRMNFVAANTNSWQSNALLIQDTLSSLTQTLSEDAASFDAITQEIDHLVHFIQLQDTTEQDLVKNLTVQFTDLVQAYQNVLQKEQSVQYDNAIAIQQLKITLATVQSTLQEQIDQLNIQQNGAQQTLEQLNNAYTVAVADNQQEAADLLAILRSVCDAYTIMIQEKQLTVDGLATILNALNNHITNAAVAFDALNTLINQ